MIRFHVIGEPKPKGSARAFVRGGRAIVTNDCATAKPWAQAVHWTARECYTDAPLSGPVAVMLAFVVKRPLRLGKRKENVPSSTPVDVDKLARNCLDALSGVLFVDDAQVSLLVASKRHANFGEASGCTITVDRQEKGVTA